MIGNYSKPSWDPRFGELDTLIAEQNRREKNSGNLVTITDAERTQRHIEHTARLKREGNARAQASNRLLEPGGSPEIARVRHLKHKTGAEAKTEPLLPGGSAETARIRRI
jgi:hypothetical protein